MNRGQEILVMTVNISDTKKDVLIVHEFDNPEILARNFIQKYNLNPRLAQPLAAQIHSNVFDLLKSAPPLAIPPQEYIPSEPSEPAQSENFGQKLYLKGLREIEKNENFKQARKVQLEEESSKELTFKPKINPISNLIVQRMVNRSQDSIRRKESAIARFHMEKQAEELSACTFVPKINQNSSKMIEGKKVGGGARFVQLYEEAYSRRKKQEVLVKQSEYPFKPEILSMANISSSRERLYSKRQNDELNTSKRDELKDPITGQDLFIPMINKGKYQRYREMPIGEHLYSLRKEEDPEPVDFYSRNPNLEARKRSEELVQKAKINRYAEIFHQLNPNDERVITYETIDPKCVEPLAFKLMQPLLDELKNEDENLDFEQFCYSMDNLLKILSPDERNVFLIWKRNKEENSQNISMRKAGSTCEVEGVYRRQVEKKMYAQARLELEREKKYRNELDGCTFKPQTTPYRSSQRRIDIS